MDLRRIRAWDWLTGLGGVVLLVALLLPWYGRGSGASATGWEALSAVDIVLAVVAAAAIALPVVTAFHRTAAVPQAMTACITVLAFAGAVLAVLRLIDPPGLADGREAGVWIAAGAALTLLVSAWRSMADPRFPAAMRPRLEVTTIPSPPPDGERRDVA